MRRTLPIGWWLVQQVAEVTAIVGLTTLIVRVLGTDSRTSQLLVFGCVVVFVVVVTYAIRSALSKDRGLSHTSGRSAGS
jgi:hypothetical protein